MAEEKNRVFNENKEGQGIEESDDYGNCHRTHPFMIEKEGKTAFGNVSNYEQINYACTGDECNYFCPVHGMCADLCEHLEKHHPEEIKEIKENE